MTKIKVIVISVSPLGKGGVATVINTLKKSKALNDQCDVCYFSSHSSGTSLEKIYTMLWAYLQFPFILLMGRYQIVHIHGSLRTSFYRKLYFLLIAKLFGLPVIYHLHASRIDEYFSSMSPLKLKITRYFFSLYSKRLCLGYPVVDKLFSYTGVPWEILHNPIDCNKPIKFQHKNNVCNFSFLGQLSQEKGIIDLLSAFATIPRNSINAYLYLAGNGNISKLTQIAAELSLSDRITFLGWIDNNEKQALLDQTDVVVLPSYSEGLPMSILEAMSNGIPVITTPVGAITDAISDGKEGILVQPGNIKSIAKAISTLAENEGIRKKMGKAAKSKSEQYFEAEIIVNQLFSLYQSLLEVNPANRQTN